jgi:hypothetical protein
MVLQPRAAVKNCETRKMALYWQQQTKKPIVTFRSSDRFVGQTGSDRIVNPELPE